MSKVLGEKIEKVYTPVGCEECHDGYHGRIAIQEVLEINEDIRDAISNNIRKAELRKLVYSGDVITLLQDGLEKVEQGYTTFEEILKLIELDDEQTAGEKLDLRSAIRDAKLHHDKQSKIHNEEPEDVKPLGVSELSMDDEHLDGDDLIIKKIEENIEKSKAHEENETLELDDETENLELEDETESLELEDEELKLDEPEEISTESLDLLEDDNKENVVIEETETLEL